MLLEVLAIVLEWVDSVESGDDFNSIVNLTAILNKANQLFLIERSALMVVEFVVPHPNLDAMESMELMLLQLCAFGRLRDIHLQHQSHLLCPTKCPQRWIPRMQAPIT